MKRGKKNLIPLAAPLALCLLSWVLTGVAVSAAVSTGAWGVSVMPELPGLPGMSERQQSAEQLTPYQAGVQAYLNGNDEEAVSLLKEALGGDVSDEKAKRLLLKVMLRTINGNYERGNYEKAHFFIKEARGYFPDNAEVRLLYSAIAESGGGPFVKARSGSPQKAAFLPPVSSARRAAARAPGAGAPAKSPEVKTRRAAPPPEKAQKLSGPAAPPGPEPPAGPGKASSEHSPGTEDSGTYRAVIAAALLLSAALFAFIYVQQKQEKELLRRIESLQKALVEGEVKRAEVYKEIEAWRKAERENAEQSATRKAKEERMVLELEKLRAQEQAKKTEELVRRRREAELSASGAGNVEPAELTSPEGPKGAQAAQPPAPNVPGEKWRRPETGGAQEISILEILADIVPPEREAAWERISVRAADLYETSPEAAIKFLYALSQDENPLNRASIVGALAGVGVPATLDILFDLYNDPSVEVRREVLKHLAGVQRNLTVRLDGAYREKLDSILRGEKAKGDWVF